MPGRYSTKTPETRKGFHVKRERTGDYRYANTGQAAPGLGEVRYSKTFSTREKAEREAAAWRATGDWKAEVIEIA